MNPLVLENAGHFPVLAFLEIENRQKTALAFLYFFQELSWHALLSVWSTALRQAFRGNASSLASSWLTLIMHRR